MLCKHACKSPACGGTWEYYHGPVWHWSLLDTALELWKEDSREKGTKIFLELLAWELFKESGFILYLKLLKGCQLPWGLSCGPPFTVFLHTPDLCLLTLFSDSTVLSKICSPFSFLFSLENLPKFIASATLTLVPRFNTQSQCSYKYLLVGVLWTSD